MASTSASGNVTARMTHLPHGPVSFYRLTIGGELVAGNCVKASRVGYNANGGDYNPSPGWGPKTGAGRGGEQFDGRNRPERQGRYTQYIGLPDRRAKTRRTVAPS